MYDTVNFRLTIDRVGDVNFLEEIPYYLDPSTVVFHSSSNDVSVTGNLQGLKVSANQYRVNVKDGSLCKWYLGDNFKTMGRQDTQQAIERLSDTLHLPMDRATITRLDVAQNIIVKYPTDVYFNHLGVLGFAKRVPQSNGLYYNKTNEQLCFYDKNKEKRSRGEPIPELYQGRNVLRYEQRYLHRLPRIFGVEVVTGALLYDEAFYIGALSRWRDTYMAIQKINDITLNFQAMTSKQDLYKMGVLAMVERVGGEIEMIEQINEAAKRGDLTSKQAYDLRDVIKKACKAGDGLTVQNEAIAELDRKILDAIRFYR